MTDRGSAPILMKKCTYCGNEYPDEATLCAIDEHPLAFAKAREVANDEASIAAGGNPGEREAARAAGRRDMVVGGLWCGGGILVTAATYNMATGGGSYLVAWGAILFGGLQFLRGLMAR